MKSISFKCSHTYPDGEKQEWTGKICPTRTGKEFTEAQISGRGSFFTVIAGKYANGNFICIPDLNVGCPAAEWKDIFWNRERLSGLMNETDAVTVAFGLKALAEERKREREAER